MMNNTLKLLLNSGLLLIVLIGMGCYGGGSSTDISVDDSNARIVIRGAMFESDGTIAPNVSIIMRPYDYIAKRQYLGKSIIENGYRVYVTSTDDNGIYRFERSDSIGCGIYCIEGWNPLSGNCIFIDSIVIDSQRTLNNDIPFIASDRTLKPPGTITGTISYVKDFTNVYVNVFGLNVSVSVDGSGNFLIDSVPQGKYRLQIVAVTSAILCDTITIATTSGTTAVIDPLLLQANVIRFTGNGTTFGTTPLLNKKYTVGDTIIVPDNRGNLEKKGYTFNGWNTKEDGSGSTYNPGDTLVIGSTGTFLYAQWVSNRGILTLSTAGNGTVLGSDTVTYRIPHTIAAIPDSGYRFIQWSIKSGTAMIADSTADSTTVLLANGDAMVQGIFRKISFIKSIHGYPYFGDFEKTSDGGFIIAGMENMNTVSANACLTKIDADGTTIWTKTIGGDRAGESGNCVKQTRDGGYIMTGFTGSFGAGICDVYLVKTNADGDTMWTRALGDASEEIGNSVLQTRDGGYIVAGIQNPVQSLPNGGSLVTGQSTDIYLVKTDTSGYLVWTKKYGGSGTDYANSILQCNDGCFIIVGHTDSYGVGSDDIYIIKTDEYGDIIWTKTFGMENSDKGYSIQKTNDGQYIVVGQLSDLYDGPNGLVTSRTTLIKFNAGGDFTWTKTVTESPGPAQCMEPTIDGGYIIGGAYSLRYGSSDVFLIKITSNGEVVWVNSGLGIGLKYHTMSLQPTIDGGYMVLSGGTGENSSLTLYKTDEKGNVK